MGEVHRSTAPSSSGKTTCILPAFLKTTFSHYFYIAFDNNQDKNFKLRSPFLISNDPDIVHQQGADFMSNVSKDSFLVSPLPGSQKIECNPNPPDFQTSETRVPNTNESSAVEVVRGRDARRLLGGLDQIFVWFRWRRDSNKVSLLVAALA